MSTIARADNLEFKQKGFENIQTRILGFLLASLLKLINLTLRWDKTGLEVNGKHWTLHSPMILVFWHGDQLMMPWAYRSRELRRGSKELHALVSMHSDGRIAAKALEYLTIRTVDGSSTRGALRALLHLKQRVGKNHHIAITPDGPKGPIFIAKQGAVMLSSSCEIPLFPVAIVAEKSWKLRSWDGMFIPKPFSKVVMLAAKPYTIPTSLSRDELEGESRKLTFLLNGLKSGALARLSS